jgi:hypothetical protein
MTLTDKAIKDAKARDSVYRLRDGNVVCRGFGVAIAPKGTKTFFLSYTSPEDGKRKQVALGAYPKVSLKEGRIKAAEVRALVDAGKDPAVEKKQGIEKRIADRELGTLGDLMALYAEDLELDGKRTAKEVRRITGRDIPAKLLTRPAHLITRDDVLDVLTPIAQRGTLIHADNVRAYLRAAFELGLHAPSMTRWRGKAKDFNITFNPVATVRKSVSRKPRGQRNLSPDEIRTLWQTDLLRSWRPVGPSLISTRSFGPSRASAARRATRPASRIWCHCRTCTSACCRLSGRKRPTRRGCSQPKASMARVATTALAMPSGAL